VHETGLSVQAQPLPDGAPLGVSPLGKAFVTVTGPLVAPDPLLVAVIEYWPSPPGAKLPLCVTPTLQEPEEEMLLPLPPQPTRTPIKQIAQQYARPCLAFIMRSLQLLKVLSPRARLETTRQGIDHG
jgi:hypothetical protein